MPTFLLTSGRIIALAFAAASLAGCGPKDNKLAVHPVTGRVRVDGQPVKDVYLIFIPSDSSVPKPTAVTDEQGNLIVTTYTTGDGAPAGDYRLSVEWPLMVNQYGRMERGKDQLGGKYKDAAAAKLTVTIAAGPNAIPDIDLKTK